MNAGIGGEDGRLSIFPATAPGRLENAAESHHAGVERAAKPDQRRWIAAELGGKHVHVTDEGYRISIVSRDGKLMARFRHDRSQRCETLGPAGTKAENALSRLKVELDDGAYIAPGERKTRRYQTASIPKLNLAELSNAYLADVRSRDGRQTAGTYGSRLDHVIAFWNLPGSRRRWPHAESLDRDFVVALTVFLNQREVCRNGRTGIATTRMSRRTIRECLATLRRMLAWAMRSDVRKLRSDFVQPVARDLLTTKPHKDPTRANPIPVDRRIAMVGQMDEYQLTHLIYPLVVVIRPEDLAGAVVEDFDLSSGVWRIGDRFDGRDFTKGHVTYQLPLPKIVANLAALAAENRAGGPMFRSRANWRGSRRPKRPFGSNAELMLNVQAELRRRGREIQTPQDGKRLIRDVIAKGGGVGKKAISNELAGLMRAAGVPGDVTAYQLKGAVTSDLQAAGLNLLELRYLTGHTTTDIMNEYTGVDPVKAMHKYSEFVAPLLEAIRQRAVVLELISENAIEGRNVDA